MAWRHNFIDAGRDIVTKFSIAVLITVTFKALHKNSRHAFYDIITYTRYWCFRSVSAKA